jgi:hypothetical protein
MQLLKQRMRFFRRQEMYELDVGRRNLVKLVEVALDREWAPIGLDCDQIGSNFASFSNSALRATYCVA